MSPQSRWPFLWFTTQIPEFLNFLNLLTIPPSFQARMLQGNSRKEVRCPPGSGEASPAIGGATDKGAEQAAPVPSPRQLHLHQFVPAEMCRCTAGDTLRGPIPPRTGLPVPGMEAESNPDPFYSCRWMQCSLRAYLIIHGWVYLSSELPSRSLLFSLCS